MKELSKYIIEAKNFKFSNGIRFGFKRHPTRSSTFQQSYDLFLNRYKDSALDFLKFANKKIVPLYKDADLFGIDLYTGDNYFFCYIKDTDKNVLVRFTVKIAKSGLLDIYNISNNKSTIEELSNKYNMDLFKKTCKNAKLSSAKNAKNVVEIIYFDDSKEKERLTLTGSIDDIFDKYTSMNDHLRYINGSWYRFADENINKIYSMYTNLSKGNYFLNHAVKHGKLID